MAWGLDALTPNASHYPVLRGQLSTKKGGGVSFATAPVETSMSGVRDQFRAVSTSLFLVIQGIMARRREPTSSI